MNDSMYSRSTRSSGTSGVSAGSSSSELLGELSIGKNGFCGSMRFSRLKQASMNCSTVSMPIRLAHLRTIAP